MRVLKKLALAASYLSSLPFLKKARSTEELSGLSSYIPAVGMLISVFLILLNFALNSLGANELLAAFLLVLCWLVLTGGIHLDGLMDSADGVFSCRDREKMLEIMKDSRVGNFGAIAGVLILGAKITSLASLAPLWLYAALLLVPAFARLVEVFAIVSFPYARESGSGKIWHESSSSKDLIFAALSLVPLCILACFAFASAMFLLPAFLTGLAGLVFVLKLQSILKAQTGDSYGASVEFSEAAGLVLLSLLQGILEA